MKSTPGESPTQVEYPKRDKFYAHRYCRLLTKTCAAQEIGHIAFVLCVTIAHTEDAKHYSGAVTFFNEQLMPLVGVSKWESLDRARRLAANHGWLHYEPGNKGLRQPGRYWVTVPASCGGLTDAPVDESQSPLNGESQPPPKGERGGDREGYRGGEHSSLSLSPSQEKKKSAAIAACTSNLQSRKQANHSSQRSRFTRPSVDDVREYCDQIGSEVDPQEFIDKNDAKGWVVGKNCTPMADWRAVVKTWQRTIEQNRPAYMNNTLCAEVP